MSSIPSMVAACRKRKLEEIERGVNASSSQVCQDIYGKMKKLLGSFGGGESLPDMSNMDPKQLAKLAKNFK